MILLMIFVILGMCATVTYQILSRSDADQARLVRQAHADIQVGG